MAAAEVVAEAPLLEAAELVAGLALAITTVVGALPVLLDEDPRPGDVAAAGDLAATTCDDGVPGTEVELPGLVKSLPESCREAHSAIS